MSEISDLNEVDANNTTLSGLPVTNATLIAQLDDLVRAQLGMLKRWFRADLFRLRDSTDQTKFLAFGLSGLTAATTRTLTVQDKSGTIALTSDLLVPSGLINGLVLTTNASDATNDIDIATGAVSDSTNVYLLTLASALTKRVDATWAVGTGNGGLDTGAVGNSTYYVFLIKRPDTGVVDAVFSLSRTAPTLPANYTPFALIGYFVRASGVNGAPIWFGTSGPIGEYISATLAVGGAITSLTPINVAAISLPPGDWDVSATGVFEPAATTNVTSYISSISFTSATLNSSVGFISQLSTAPGVPGNFGNTIIVGPTRISITTTTTLYLVTRATFTVSTMLGYGAIRARRMR